MAALMMALLVGLATGEAVYAADIASLQKRAAAGEAQAQFDLGLAYQSGREVKRDMPRAIAFYRQAAAQKHAPAINNLGAAYLRGDGVARDRPKALALLEQAVGLGYRVAMYNLGSEYFTSQPPDYARAFALFTQSAEKGHLNAMRALVDVYSEGRGTARDPAMATEWARKSATGGCMKAKTMLAISYQHGRGVPADLPVAVALYREAAEAGDPVAQHNLGLRYARGEGVARDGAEAVRWFRRAADQGFARAFNALGAMTSDQAESLRLYRLAAERGDSDGQTNLGRAYQDGTGVKPDPVAAYMWLQLAARQGVEMAKVSLDKLRPRLTPEQGRRGEAAVRAWRPRPSPPQIGPSDRELGCESD